MSTARAMAREGDGGLLSVEGPLGMKDGDDMNYDGDTDAGQ